MSQTCDYCYRIVHRACQSPTEASDCPRVLEDWARKLNDVFGELRRMAARGATEAERRKFIDDAMNELAPLRARAMGSRSVH